MNEFTNHVIILKNAFCNFNDSDFIEKSFIEYFPKILSFLIEDSKNNFKDSGLSIHYDGERIIESLHEAIIIKNFNSNL